MTSADICPAAAVPPPPATATAEASEPGAGAMICTLMTSAVADTDAAAAV